MRKLGLDELEAIFAERGGLTDEQMVRLFEIANTFARLDREAAIHVEGQIALRSRYFTGEEPYVGWKGLGLALKEDYDDLERFRETTIALGQEDWDKFIAELDRPPQPNEKLRAMFKKYQAMRNVAGEE